MIKLACFLLRIKCDGFWRSVEIICTSVFISTSTEHSFIWSGSCSGSDSWTSLAPSSPRKVIWKVETKINAWRGLEQFSFELARTKIITVNFIHLYQKYEDLEISWYILHCNFQSITEACRHCFPSRSTDLLRGFSSSQLLIAPISTQALKCLSIPWVKDKAKLFRNHCKKSQRMATHTFMKIKPYIKGGNKWILVMIP